MSDAFARMDDDESYFRPRRSSRAFIAAKRVSKRKLRRPALVQATNCVFAACFASVSHLSAISMKKDLCGEVRAASANRMHSAAFSRNWSKLGKGVSISILR
jgi:hypothetical protein